MNPSIQVKKAALVFVVTLVCFGLLPTTQAVIPPPDGGYPGGNTAEGQNALLSLSSGGYNTAVGWTENFRGQVHAAILGLTRCEAARASGPDKVTAD
jgi:hypothetical protein